MALQYSAAILSGRVLLVLIPKTGLPPPWRWFLHTSTFAATWGLDRVMLSGLQEQFLGWKSSQVIILPQERVFILLFWAIMLCGEADSALEPDDEKKKELVLVTKPHT